MGAEEWVVLASLDSRHAAEHMLASLGRGFRKKARSGHASAFVLSGRADGSLELTQSRVLTASGIAATLIRVSTSLMLGFLGMLSTLKGVRGGAHALHVHAGHVGADEHRAHEILGEAGPDAALVLVRCDDPEMQQAVVRVASERGRYRWHGSMSQFLTQLDPGSQHDWVRSALGS